MTRRDADTPRRFTALLSDVLDSMTGSHKAMAYACGVAKQAVYSMLQSEKANPFEKAAETYAALVEVGNPRADELIVALADECGFEAYKRSPVLLVDADLAAAMQEFSQVIAARSSAEADGRISAEDHWKIAREAEEAAQKLLAYRDKNRRMAADLDAKPTLRIAR